MRLCSKHGVLLVLQQATYVVRGQLWSWLYWQCPVDGCTYARPHKTTCPRLEY